MKNRCPFGGITTWLSPCSAVAEFFYGSARAAAIPQTLAGGGNCLLCAAIMSGVALTALGIYLIWWNIQSIWGRKP
jgi:hypothetical protein